MTEQMTDDVAMRLQHKLWGAMSMWRLRPDDHPDLPQRTADLAAILDRYVAWERAQVAAAMPCYCRWYNEDESGICNHEYWGEAACPSCKARIARDALAAEGVKDE